MNAQAERDAQTIRVARHKLRHSQPIDSLHKRMRVVEFWKDCELTNPLYKGPHASALYRNAGFRRYLMPRLAAWLKARELARRTARADEMREECQARQRQQALKNAPPLPLFPQAA